MVHLPLPKDVSWGRKSIPLRGGTQASNWRSVASTSHGRSGRAHDMTARTALAGLKCGPAGSNGGTHRPTAVAYQVALRAPCRNLPDSICGIDHFSVIPRRANAIFASTTKCAISPRQVDRL